jgi:hypothetical protein
MVRHALEAWSASLDDFLCRNRGPPGRPQDDSVMGYLACLGLRLVPDFQSRCLFFPIAWHHCGKENLRSGTF